GKFAQNPRRFKEHFITDIGARPFIDMENEDEAKEWQETWGALPAVENFALGYAIWERPQDKLRFNNVGTAASITGAARAVLMEAICNADDPIYCDTDSLICRDLHNTDLHSDRLGAWKLEEEFEEVAIAGKKLYACRRADGSEKVRSKGASGLSFGDMVEVVNAEIDDFVKTVRSKGVTLTKHGQQFYLERRVRATA